MTFANNLNHKYSIGSNTVQESLVKNKQSPPHSKGRHFFSVGTFLFYMLQTADTSLKETFTSKIWYNGLLSPPLDSLQGNWVDVIDRMVSRLIESIGFHCIVTLY